MLTQTFDEDMNVEQLTKQIIAKMQLISKLHMLILCNNAQA
jgi:hypothetical protein